MPQLLGFDLPDLYVSVVFSLASPIATLPLIIYFSRKSRVQLKWQVKLPGIQIIFLLALLAVFVKIFTTPLNNPMEYFNNLIDRRLKLIDLNIPEFDLKMTIKLISYVLITPVFEEIFWRKQIMGQLLKKYPPVMAIVLSSILFAIGHLRIIDFVTLFIWGLLLGFVYYRTNSIEASILLHSFALSSSLFSKHEFIDITGPLLFKYASAMTVSVIAIVLIIKYLGRYRTVNKINGAETSIVS